MSKAKKVIKFTGAENVDLSPRQMLISLLNDVELIESLAIVFHTKDGVTCCVHSNQSKNDLLWAAQNLMNQAIKQMEDGNG